MPGLAGVCPCESMTTAYFTHACFLEHDTGSNHPECPDRLRAVNKSLSDEKFGALDRRTPPEVDRAAIARVHSVDYIDSVFDRIPQEGRAHLDPDTVVSNGSQEAVLRAAGAVTAAVDAVHSGDVQNAFCAIRPPGHHAERDKAMGFCVFNNVAIGAAHARHALGLGRVAVIDFDVHHGNGTQSFFAADEDYFFASTHQFPHYPGTGAADEVGVGNIVNVPLLAGSGSAEFRQGMEKIVLPRLKSFDPDFLFISAGFDAHLDDPLGDLNLTEADYVWATSVLLALATDCCDGRVVSVLEGGYNFDALGNSVGAHVGALMSAP